MYSLSVRTSRALLLVRTSLTSARRRVHRHAPLQFYEAYVDADAVDTHKAMPHFKLWSDFKASGGCTSVSTKAVPLGDWGFQ